MSVPGDYTADLGFRQRNSVLKSVNAADPAAGAEVTYTVPAGSGLLLKAVRVRLVTSAVVANRVPILTIADDNANTVMEFPASAAQAASLTVDYSFVADLGYAMAAAVANKLAVGIAPFLYLPDGWTIKTVTSAIDVGDNYGVPIITGEVF